MIRGLVSVDRARSPKLFEPVVRERLLERLALACAYRIALVAAPAGFGKSVAIRHFLERDASAFVRFGMRREHDSLLAFVRGFVTAIEAIAPKASRSVAGAYERAQRSPDPSSHVASWLAVLLRDYRGTIVIEDIHYGLDPAISATIAELVEKTPENVRWLLATRDTMQLPIASWMAYSRMDMPIDEIDLRLSFDEALTAARDATLRLREEDVRSLLDFTDGWPTAFGFALRATGRTADFTQVADGTREMIYGFLAEQVFRSLAEDDRSFLMATAPLPTLDLDVLEGAGLVDAAARIGKLRRRTAFITVEGERTFRYHDLFREFLEFQLREVGSDAYARALCAAGEMLMQADRWVDALPLFIAAGDEERTMGLLDDRASDIVDRSLFEFVEAAERAFDIDASAHPRIVALRAAAFAFRGDYKRAEHFYDRAQREAPSPDDRAEILFRFAIVYYQSGRIDEAIALFARIDVNVLASPALAARILALHGSILAAAGFSEAATAVIAPALRALPGLDDEIAGVVIRQYAAIVALASGRFDDARALSERAVATAESLGLYSIAARASSVLCNVEYDVGDFARYGWTLAQMRHFAERAGDERALAYAAIGLYDLAVARGDLDRVAALENAVAKTTLGDVGESDDLLPAFALQAAWTRDFARAHAISLKAASASISAARRGERWAENFVYAAACGERAKAQEAAERVQGALGEVEAAMAGTTRTLTTRCLYALGLILIGRGSSANNSLRALESGEFGRLSVPITRLAEAIRAIYVQMETSSGHHGVAAALDALYPVNFGGYARLLEVLPIPVGSSFPRFAALTKSEMRVLHLLGRGYTSRAAAHEMGRSVLTVDSHVKSIVRKLDCSGRREAVSIARLHGII